MTKVILTIQDREGKPTLTWLEQQGDQLPEELWTEVNLAIARVFDKIENQIN